MPVLQDDLYVCNKCFGDDGLQAFIEDNAVERFCSFCGRKSKKPISAHLEDVVSYIEDCIHEEYDDPANWLPYESAEGGYQGETWITFELLSDEIGIDLPKDRSGMN
jgi:Zn ribbon nucleic-acid-binding protein